MRRRCYLRSIAGLASTGAAGVAAGCLGGSDDGSGEDGGGTSEGDTGRSTDGGDETGGDGDDWLDALPTIPAGAEPTGVELSYPTYQPSYYPITASPARSDAGAVSFAEATPAAQVEIATAVVRGEHVTTQPAVLDAELHQSPVAFGGSAYSIVVAVADRFAPPEHGPEGDQDWRAPVTLETATVDGSFWVRLRNELDRPLPLHHYGRPYVGALVAVGDGEYTVLPHEAYASNRFIATGDPVRTTRVSGDERTTDLLGPREAMTERYDLPDDVPEGARVWCSLSIGDDSIDLLGNQRTTATCVATID